jgi:HAD superfamily hydrolase (TIGR01450 family)
VLGSSDRPLWASYDLAMLDLDGVVYIGPDAVPQAPRHLAAAREAGMSLAYVTNNASRTPAAVAAHLRELGIDVDDGDVVTSAQAAARLLADRLPESTRVFVIGGEGLQVALRERGLEPVQEAEPRPAAVVSGFSADLRWGTVIDGAILVREGLPWVASNTDLTVPTPRGPGPGNGALVGAVARFAEREPEVAGKPEVPLLEETLRRVGGQHPLVVGDRLDTDIEGAVNAGYDSLLVMTGVTALRQLVEAAPQMRPTYVGTDLGSLGRDHPPVHQDGDVFRCGGWEARVEDGRVSVAGSGAPDCWWRAVASAAWEARDADGAVDVESLSPPGSVGGTDDTDDTDEPDGSGEQP